MGPKCPSCGFESAEGAPFCDFCKEPFRKAKAASVPVPSEDAKRLLAGLPPELLAKIPPQLLSAKEEKLPPVEPWVRYAAWGFLGFWLIAGFITAGIWAARYQARQDEASPGTTVIVEER